jgi:hypothetical protein
VLLGLPGVLVEGGFVDLLGLGGVVVENLANGFVSLS